MKIELPNAEVCYYANFFESADELYQRVQESTNWKQQDVMIYGKSTPQPRLTAWYGDHAYTYSGLTVEPQPLTPAILEIKQKVEAVAETEFNSVLLNLYRDGNDSIGWHSDNEKGLGDVIASVSFGSARRFLLRDIATRTKSAEIALGNGDLLVMGQGVQKNYHHHVPKTKLEVGPRINLTFRRMEGATSPSGATNPCGEK